MSASLYVATVVVSVLQTPCKTIITFHYYVNHRHWWTVYSSLYMYYWLSSIVFKYILCNVLYGDPDEGHRPKHVGCTMKLLFTLLEFSFFGAFQLLKQLHIYTFRIFQLGSRILYVCNYTFVWKNHIKC